MIGNGYPWRDSSYIVVEEGVINPHTLGLTVHQYQVVDKYGTLLKDGFKSLADAGSYIDSLLLVRSVKS